MCLWSWEGDEEDMGSKKPAVMMYVSRDTYYWKLGVRLATLIDARWEIVS